MPTYEIDITIAHRCGQQCWKCQGSGEGMYDGSRCTVCKGRCWIGEDVEGEFTVEVDEQGKLTSSVRCDECGTDLSEEAQEQAREIFNG